MKIIHEGKYLEFGFFKEEWHFLPTVFYVPKKYRYSHTRPINIMFLTLYISIGKIRGKLSFKSDIW